MSKAEWSASVRCADLRHFEADIRSFEEAGCTELHFDVRDGRFAPGFGLGLEILGAAKACSQLPCGVHLMTEQPERHVETFAKAGCASLTVHVEACLHAPRTLELIRELGMASGIAIQPATPLTKLEYLLSFADRVLLLTQEPGNERAETPRAAFERVRILQESLSYHEHGTQLQVKGGIGALDAARLLTEGADIVVLDSPEIFAGDDTLGSLKSFIDRVETARETA